MRCSSERQAHGNGALWFLSFLSVHLRSRAAILSAVRDSPLSPNDSSNRNLSPMATYKEPDIRVDIYGTSAKAPRAARFGVGATTLAEVRDACEKQQRNVPGQYCESHKK